MIRVDKLPRDIQKSESLKPICLLGPLRTEEHLWRIPISIYVFHAISKLNMDNNYSAILQERTNILHLNNLYLLRRCMQVAILFKILTCQPTWYIREVYSGLPERPEIVRLSLKQHWSIWKGLISIIRRYSASPKWDGAGCLGFHTTSVAHVLLNLWYSVR